MRSIGARLGTADMPTYKRRFHVIARSLRRFCSEEWLFCCVIRDRAPIGRRVHRHAEEV